MVHDYPEPGSFGPTPSWGLFARHAKGLAVHHAVFWVESADLRPPVALDDVQGASFEHVTALPSAGIPTFEFGDVRDFTAQSCAGVPDTVLPKAGRGASL